MKTYLVLIPNAPGQRLAVTLYDDYQVFEVSESLVIPIKRRPQMPSVTDWQNCDTKEEAVRLAKNK